MQARLGSFPPHTNRAGGLCGLADQLPSTKRARLTDFGGFGEAPAAAPAGALDPAAFGAAPAPASAPAALDPSAFGAAPAPAPAGMLHPGAFGEAPASAPAGMQDEEEEEAEEAEEAEEEERVAVVQVEGGAARPAGADESLRDQVAALKRQLGEAQAALREHAERDSEVEVRLVALQHARRALRPP